MPIVDVPEGGDALRAASVQTLLRLEPGHGQPTARHLTLLAEVDPGPAPAVWTDARAGVLASILAARARRDALADGLALPQRYFEDGRLTRPASMSASTRSRLYASVSEYCSATGWPQIAARYAAESLLFAETDAQRYRAHSVHALALALNAEYIAAAAAIEQAHALFTAHGWHDDDLSHCLCLGEAMLALTRADVGRLRELADALQRTPSDQPYWNFGAAVMRVAAHFFDRDLAAGLAESRRLLHASDRARSPRLQRDLLLGMHADMLALHGEFDEALAVLATGVTQPGHAVCFPMQRAATLLLTGREREVIESTNACVAMHDEHCLRTLTPLLTRRAVAFLRLGHPRRATQSMESAIELISRTGGSLMPFLMIPSADAARLLDLVADERGDLVETITAMRAALPALAARQSMSPALSPLSPAERELATLLRTDQTTAEIARARGVSVNTVKSQMRSIYSKLGVSRREEAVAILDVHSD